MPPLAPIPLDSERLIRIAALIASPPADFEVLLTEAFDAGFWIGNLTRAPVFSSWHCMVRSDWFGSFVEAPTPRAAVLEALWRTALKVAYSDHFGDGQRRSASPVREQKIEITLDDLLKGPKQGDLPL